mmetsp:Transcript_7333/g.31155  ORF Transcript_7333/g.31155 Transcript_7333/m.31155 type:complete len:129 (+) Transcript_7333:160-546(+)
MGFERMAQSHGRVLGVEVTGKVTKEDYTVFLEPTIDELVAKYGSVHLLVKMTVFEGAELKAMWHEKVLGLKHNKHIDRVAMLGKHSWEAALLALSKPFAKAKMQYFNIEDEALAWEFVNKGNDCADDE